MLFKARQLVLILGEILLHFLFLAFRSGALYNEAAAIHQLRQYTTISARKHSSAPRNAMPLGSHLVCGSVFAGDKRVRLLAQGVVIVEVEESADGEYVQSHADHEDNCSNTPVACKR